MTGEIVPTEKLRVRDVQKKFEDETQWAQFRTKKDRKTGKTYFDVLVGLKGKKPHAHFGINLDQTIRFSQSRKTTHSIKRTGVSKRAQCK